MSTTTVRPPRRSLVGLLLAVGLAIGCVASVPGSGTPAASPLTEIAAVASLAPSPSSPPSRVPAASASPSPSVSSAPLPWWALLGFPNPWSVTPPPSGPLPSGLSPLVGASPSPGAPSATAPVATPAPPRATPRPTPTPKPPAIASGPNYRVATRVVLRALRIDLPVIRQRTAYPACNVAMYLPIFKQPGQGGATYLYAHARTGMFLPLLQRSLVNDGRSMIGMIVQVYTGDDKVFVYRIDEVRRHALDLRYVKARKRESLWLQTSEGPKGTKPKLQVGASLLSSGPASHAASHPVPRPVNCG